MEKCEQPVWEKSMDSDFYTFTIGHNRSWEDAATKIIHFLGEYPFVALRIEKGDIIRSPWLSLLFATWMFSKAHVLKAWSQGGHYGRTVAFLRVGFFLFKSLRMTPNRDCGGSGLFLSFVWLVCPATCSHCNVLSDKFNQSLTKNCKIGCSQTIWISVH